MACTSTEISRVIERMNQCIVVMMTDSLICSDGGFEWAAAAGDMLAAVKKTLADLHLNANS